MFGQSGVPLDDRERLFVHDALAVELDRGDDKTLAPHVAGLDRQAPGNHATDIVVVAEHLGEADQAVALEDGHCGAQIGDVADAAAAVVRVVPEEHIARVDVVGVEVLEDRFDERRIGPAGELSPTGVEQCDAIVVLVADHRRPGCALDGGFDLEFGRADRACDHLEFNRPEGPRLRAHCVASIRMFPCSSTAAVQPGGTTIVEPYSWITAGLAIRAPFGSSYRS